MPNQNSQPNNQNQPNGANFSQNPHVADKHVNNIVSPNTRSQSNANVPTQPTAAPNRPNQFINPSNFEKVLGSENVVLPESQKLDPVTKQQVSQSIRQDLNQVIPDRPLNEYQNIRQIAGQRTPHKEYDILKLVLYVVPIIAIFVHILKPVENDIVKWHAKQSLVGQLIWFGIMIFLRIIDVLILSDVGVTLWNIVCYGLLLIAGIQAYNGQMYQLPIAYDLGKNFIEEKN